MAIRPWHNLSTGGHGHLIRMLESPDDGATNVIVYRINGLRLLVEGYMAWPSAHGLLSCQSFVYYIPMICHDFSAFRSQILILLVFTNQHLNISLDTMVMFLN